MPVTMLDGGAAVSLPRRPLQVRVRPAGPIDLLLEVRTDQAGGTSVRHPQPGLIVLPTVGAPATVVVRSVDGRPFPASASVSVDVVSGAAALADPDRAVLSHVRLGGLIERELVAVAGAGTELLVRAAGEQTAEVDLGRLGNAARAAASSLLGAALVPETDAVNVVLAVDRSASFRPRAEDGSLEAVVSVLSGIAATIVRDRRIGAALVGADVSWLAIREPIELAAAIRDGVQGTMRTSTFRSAAPAVADFDPDHNTQVYLITDSVPADLDALEAVEREEGQGRHLVVLAPASAALASRSTTLSSTIVGPAADLEHRLLTDVALLTALVRDLLRGCFASGSPSFERLGS